MIHVVYACPGNRTSDCDVVRAMNHFEVKSIERRTFLLNLYALDSIFGGGKVLRSENSSSTLDDATQLARG